MMYLNNIKCRICGHKTVYIDCCDLTRIEQNVLTEDQLEELRHSPKSMFVCDNCRSVWWAEIEKWIARQTTYHEFIT